MSKINRAQATDLAKHFLGPEWIAFEFLGAHVLQNLKTANYFRGTSWRDAFRAAGVKLPFRPRFTAHSLRVMLEDKAVCTAVSVTMAKRISNALNSYQPGPRGA